LLRSSPFEHDNIGVSRGRSFPDGFREEQNLGIRRLAAELPRNWIWSIASRLIGRAFTWMETEIDDWIQEEISGSRLAAELAFLMFIQFEDDDLSD